MSEQKDIDAISGVETTGHEWDGIKELNNPLPNWWRWIFYATVVWSIGYWIVYPAWPTLSGYTQGVIGYSSRAEVAARLSEAEAAKSGYLARIEQASLEEIRSDEDLLNFALAGGRSAFAVNCSQCHGSGAQGSAGYPNLNDDEWLWGGDLEAIAFTIRHGIRNTVDEEAHYSEMPRFGTDEILTREEIASVAAYVRLVSGQDVEVDLAAGGSEVYAEQCAACHGENGGGDVTLGAPALNNAIWLYGGDQDAVVETITKSRYGVMPPWGRILDDATIKQLAVYVHSLGGGQ
ncbi:MAG: cytochrome-c oxidase, cbb3-type subunit III [Rhodospirillales bacterium]